MHIIFIIFEWRFCDYLVKDILQNKPLQSIFWESNGLEKLIKNTICHKINCQCHIYIVPKFGDPQQFRVGGFQRPQGVGCMVGLEVLSLFFYRKYCSEFCSQLQVLNSMLLISENQLAWHPVNMNFGLIGKDGNLSVSQPVREC